MEANLQQTAIAVTKSLKGLFKTLLKSHERITAWGTCFVFISSQQVLGHGGDDRPGKQVRGQHSENHSFVHVLLGFRLAVAIYVLDLNGRVVHQDADRQSESTERHNIDRFSDRA